MADIIITNGRLVTYDDDRPQAQALAIGGGRILAVGSNDEIAAHRGPSTRSYDAGGATVLPGFIDAHVHLFMGSAELNQLQLADVTSEDALTRAVRAFAASRPNERLVYASSATLALLGGAPITREVLDRVLPDRPLAIMGADHHIVWANTPALEAAGILDRAGPVTGGEIVAGPDGRANGQLFEAAAFAPVLAMTPLGGRDLFGYASGRDPSPAPTAEQRRLDRETLVAGLRHAARNGITTLHNMDGNFYQLELLEEIEAEGNLLARVQVPFHLKPENPLERIVEAEEMRRRWHSDTLWSDRIKMFMDGIMESRTGLMLRNYPDTPHNGSELFPPEQFREACIRADAMGLQISVHAIGDGAVRATLNGFQAAREANGARDSRHRIEHIEVIHPDDVPRLAELGAVASMQPTHAAVAGLFPPPAPNTTHHDDQWAFCTPWRTLREAGAAMVFSTDWPVAPLEPGVTLKAAVAPRKIERYGDQRQTLDETLASYTRDAAWLEFTEDRKGKLIPGYLADVVVMAQDLHAMEPDTLDQARPVLTICDGRVTFEG